MKNIDPRHRGWLRRNCWAVWLSLATLFAVPVLMLLSLTWLYPRPEGSLARLVRPPPGSCWRGPETGIGPCLAWGCWFWR